MKPLPMPLRLTAGLLATAVEQARELPRKVVELPVTAVSQAMQVSMRVQQRITELAIKGDKTLGMLRPVADSPSWARFDDDDAEPGTANGVVTELRAPDFAAEDLAADDDFATEDFPAEDFAADAVFAAEDSAADAQTEPADQADEALPAADGPAALAGYDEMSIAQLRARLRRLSLDQLEQLLAWETSHLDRPPYVTMLGNRITTVSSS